MLSERSYKKKSHIVWFHLYEITRIGESVATDNRLVVIGGYEDRVWRWLLTWHGSFLDDKNVVELDRDNGCIILWT